jgi:hypothetical protein
MKEIVALLRVHGVVVETTKQEESLNVEQYTIKQVTQAPRAFQGHKETRLTVAASDVKETFPIGSFIVSMQQPKAALIFYLLEAESDDGLVNWNYLDRVFERTTKDGTPTVYPIYRAKTQPNVAREIVK